MYKCTIYNHQFNYQRKKYLDSRWLKVLRFSFESIYIMLSIIQSAKILFLPPKCEIIMVPSIVKLSPLILFESFLVSVLCFFFDVSLAKVIGLPTISDSCRSFSLLKAIAKKLTLLFANAFKRVKMRQLLLSQ